MQSTLESSAFRPVQETGWRMGFRNLLRFEFGRWWTTRKWWIQTLLWLALLPGLLVALMVGETVGMPGFEGFFEDPANAIQFWAGNTGFLAAIGVIVLMQGALVGEKDSGVTAWILSKPASRTSYIVSKLISNAVGVLVTIVVVPGLAVYLLTSLIVAGEWLAPMPFLAAMSVIALELLFYLTFTLMLGTIFDGRGFVVGVALAFLLLQDLLGSAVPFALNFLPMVLSRSLALPIALGESLPPFAALPALTPVFATAAWTVVCVGVALWRFGREEF